MSGEHSLLAPSAAPRWINCPGSIALIGDDVFTGNKEAAQGTVAHWLGEQALRTGKDCTHWLGTEREVIGDDGTERWTFTCDEEMCSYVQVYVDYCRRLAQEFPGATLVEHHTDLSEAYGIIDQGGTSDYVQVDALITSTFEVVDLKYGYVKVYPDSEQLKSYGLGILLEHVGIFEDSDEVRLTIVQPRLDHIDTHTMTVGELKQFGETAKASAGLAISNIESFKQHRDVALLNLVPGDKQCQWCPAKERCPRLEQYVMDTVFPDMEATDVDENTLTNVISNVTADVERLSIARGVVPLIQSWCKAICSEVDARTHRHDMPGWKLVAGKRGNRAWRDDDEAIALLKSMRLKNEIMYTQTIITPTVAEKTLTTKRWAKAAELVTQSAGKPKVVPSTDPGEEIPAPDLFATSNDPTIEGLI